VVDLNMARKTRPEPVPPSPRARRARKRGPDVACLTAYLPPELARALRVRAATDGRTASAIVADALASHLGRMAGV